MTRSVLYYIEINYKNKIIFFGYLKNLKKSFNSFQRPRFTLIINIQDFILCLCELKNQVAPKIFSHSR